MRPTRTRRWSTLGLVLLFGVTGFPTTATTAAEDGALVAGASKKKRRQKRRGQRPVKRTFSELPRFEKNDRQPEEDSEALPTSPAKIRLPMVEERKADAAALEEQLLDQEIEQLKEIVRDTSEGPARADLYFRLAERYYEKARAIYYKEMQQYDNAVEQWIQKRKSDPDAPEPKIDNRGSQVFTEQAMRIYEIILEKYKEYQRRDEAFFTMGYNLYESGKKPEGIEMYRELIKAYPNSRFVPDAYLAIGEHYFNHNDVFNAKKAYQRALRFSESKVYAFALYKLSWCDYNLGHYEGAIEKLKRVVERADRESRQTGGDRSKIQLKREALQDMVLAFSQIDALDAAEAYYLSQLGKNGALAYLRKLARTYEKQGKAEMTVGAYRRLLNEYPTHPDCPSFHNSIVLAYRKMNERDRFKREINRLIDQYKPGSTWAEVNRNNIIAVKKANALVESSLRDLVTAYHQEAQETKSWETYNLARAIYGKYLKTFPQSEYAYQLRWYYADILYKMRDFYTAARQYARVVETDPKGDYTAEAAYNAVLCWEKCIELRDGENRDCRDWRAHSGRKKLQPEASKMIKKQDYRFVDKGVTEDMLAEREIPFFEKRLLQAADVYSEVARGHDMYIPIRFKSAFIYYQYRHFAEMAKRFGEIIERYPRNELALRAVRLSLNSLYMKARQADASDQVRTQAWKDVNHWAKTFKANKVLMGSRAARQERFAAEIQSLIEESAYNMVLAVRKTDPLTGARGFDRFVADHPRSKYAHRARYAAMVIYDEANQLDLAINAGKRLVKQYPGSDRVHQTLGYLASLHERVADFASAAKYNELTFQKWLERVDQTDGKRTDSKRRAGSGRKKAGKESEVTRITAKQASDALYNAAVLRESMGELGKAISNYGKYIKYFPENADCKDLFLRMGEIYERQGKWRKADIIYQGYLDKYKERSSPDRNLAVLYKHAMALRELSKHVESDRLLHDIITSFRMLDKQARGPEARAAFSHARFLQVEEQYARFVDLKLVLPHRTLMRNLHEKIKIWRHLEKTYKEIVGHREPAWSIASLVRIGQISQHMADAMLEAPIPAGLTSEQADIYIEELQKQALPLEERAIQFYRRAIEVSNTGGIYGEWMLKAQDLLRKYEPNRYPEPHLAEPRLTELFYEAGFRLVKVEVPPQAEPAPSEAGADSSGALDGAAGRRPSR